MNALAAGLALGVAGSVHCVAMCGPLVMAVAPRGRRAAWYHAARCSVYVVMGICAGLVGGSIAAAGFGRWLAFLMAGVLVVQATSRITTASTSGLNGSVARAIRRMSAVVGAWARRHPTVGSIGLGAMNGLLPCGLLYAAVAAATGFGSLTAAVLFMGGVGVGTTPLLRVGALSIDALRARLPGLSRATPLLLLLLAVWLVARGLQLPGYPAHVH
jgi:sulfite exporter TauE/SafE